VKSSDVVCPFCGARTRATQADGAVLPARVLAMVAVAALASCEDESKPVSEPVDAGTKQEEVAPRDPVAPKDPVTPTEPVTAVPPYGVAMPPPRDDEGAAVPAYGAPPPRPSGPLGVE